jgi:hypothetical protein
MDKWGVHQKKLKGIYAQVSTVFSTVFAGFVGDAILRAGDGCFGLAIKDYCAVHV